MDADVIIAGAGASGLAAAARIRAAGKVPLLLEARDRLGGRIHTDRSFASFPVERGAEMVTGSRSRVRAAVQAAGLPCAPAMSPWRGRVLAEGRLRRVVPWMLGSVWAFNGIVREIQRERAGDESVGAVLDRRRASPRVRLLVNALVNSACALPDQLSVRETRRFLMHNEETGGDSRVVDGYDRLVEHLASGLEIVRNAPVATVTWSPSAVSVEADRRYIGRVAIVTVPLGVLQRGRLRFEPALPSAHEKAIGGLAMHGGMKVLMRFSDSLWPRGMSYLMLDEDIPVVWPARDGETVLTAFVMGARADSLRAAPGPVERVLASLSRVWGDEPRRRLVDAAVVDWGSDPWTFGGYSSVPPGAYGLRAALAAPCESVIFAGEAADEIAPGTVSGAIRAGERAADHAIARLSLAASDIDAGT